MKTTIFLLLAVLRSMGSGGGGGAGDTLDDLGCLRYDGPNACEAAGEVSYWCPQRAPAECGAALGGVYHCCPEQR